VGYRSPLLTLRAMMGAVAVWMFQRIVRTVRGSTHRTGNGSVVAVAGGWCHVAGSDAVGNADVDGVWGLLTGAVVHS
jgi:hypothetical protein